MAHKNPLKVFGLEDNRHGRPSKKVLSRRWMFAMYRTVSGNVRLPPPLQYWTLAGPMVDETDPKHLQPRCEVKQATQEGLINLRQYIGVENNPKFHALNAQQTELPLTLEFGEIDEVLFDYVEREAFRPGIINLDSTHGLNRAVSLLARVNRVLRHHGGTEPLVLFLNVELGNRFSGIHHNREREMVQAVQQSTEVSGMLLDEGWQLAGAGQYHGTGSLSRSAMCMYCFTRGFEVRARRVA